MTVKLITAPSSEPVTVAEFKTRMRWSTSTLDAAIGALITAAREQAEHMTGRALMPQTWEKVLDAFPDNEIKLPHPPLVSIVSVTYIDIDGASQTLASTEYTADTDSEPGWLLLAYNKSWPSTRDSANAVRVRYTCGYANAAAVPESIKNWMMLKVGESLENGEASSERPVIAHSFVDHLLDRWLVPEI